MKKMENSSILNLQLSLEIPLETIHFVDSDYSQDTITTEKHSSHSSSTVISSVTEDLYSDDCFESSTDDGDSSKELIVSTASVVLPTKLEIETKKQFLRQKIDILKNRPLGQNYVKRCTEQSFQLEEYSTKKLALLRNSFKSKNIQEKIATRTEQYPKHMHTQKLLKNTRKLEQLKIENAIFEVEKKIACPLHQPRKCKKCRQLQSKLSEKEYLKRKTAQLRNHHFCYELEKHLYHKDSVTLIADIINSGMKLTDPPQELWDRLLKKGKYS